MPLCITGMHRSGTSMIAAALGLCGLDLGYKEQLQRPDEDHSFGGWENQFFVDLNERVLAALDGAWDLPPDEAPGWEQAPVLAPLREQARRLAETFAESEPWGFKDPRCALLLPFWQAVLPALRVVVCLRDPNEVASSLNRRGGSSLLFGRRLWHEYYRRLLAHTARAQRLVVDYASCLLHPEAELRRVASFAGVAVTPEAAASMKSGLRHHAWNGAVDPLYETLRREAAAVPPHTPSFPTSSRRKPSPLRAIVTVDLTREGRGVRSMAGLVAMKREVGRALYEATTADPQLLLDVPAFPSESVRAVRFRMRRGTKEAAVAQLFWTHSEEENFSEGLSALASLEPAGAGWSEYVFRLDRSPLVERWRAGRTVARLRFDPVNVAGVIEVESLVLEG